MAVGPPGNNMNALVIGYGSIGRRHALNLAQLDCIDEIAVYTKIKNDAGPTGKKKIAFIDASNVALSAACQSLKVGFAIIANETYKHVPTAITLAENGYDLFIEKPLSHNLENIDALEEIARSKKIKIFLAYNLRFLPAIRLIKERLAQQAIGNLYFAKIEMGQYLSSWRKNINYQACYSANTAYGGGVELDLSHEIDYMRYLFGDPLRWKTLKSKVSKLEINSADLFEGIYEYQDGFVCNVHMDYLQSKARRQIRIAGSTGTIECDIFNNQWKVCSGDQEICMTDEKLFRISDTYISELQHFIKIIQSGEEPMVGVGDGKRVLQLLGDNYV